MSLKTLFIDDLVTKLVAEKPDTPLRILDLGCGTAVYVPELLAKFPQVTYVGIEPIAAWYIVAEQTLRDVPRATVIHALGYEPVAAADPGSFDLVFSLSVLEHVKHLDRFIALGASYVKKGGLCVHRYDLGHALSPCSLKERLHVWLGNTIPAVLPERQFVRYVSEEEVRALYATVGLTVTGVTYHQMPSHKAFEKIPDRDGTVAQKVGELYAWEASIQPLLTQVPVLERERMFPAVAVWGQKTK